MTDVVKRKKRQAVDGRKTFADHPTKGVSAPCMTKSSHSSTKRPGVSQNMTTDLDTSQRQKNVKKAHENDT